MNEAPVKCTHCSGGYRHPVGNCVLCGQGPAPGAVNFFGEPMPKRNKERAIVVWKLFHNFHPPTLNGMDYPTDDQLKRFHPPAMVETAWERFLNEAAEKSDAHP